MKFGPVPVELSPGAIIAHSIRLDGLVLKKGDIVREEHVAVIRDAGLAEIVVAQLEKTDLGENEAARLIAETLGGPHASVDRAFTGRANLFARRGGVLQVDVEAINRINAVDEAITVATLPSFRTVVPGEMIATVKIIPFAVPVEAVNRTLDMIESPSIDIAPFKALRVGVISTLLHGLKPSVITRTLSHLADRLAPAEARIVRDERVAHDTALLSAALRSIIGSCDLVVIFGASAITDRRDVIPAAIQNAGGTIEHFGMPVDPGNLLLLAHIGEVPVIGAPGCARSPKENGFDWVLHRLLAGLDVTGNDIRRLGVGGLLMEIVSRPQPRTMTAQRVPTKVESSSAEERESVAP